MTQEIVNKCFETEFGQQLDQLFSTSDDRLFVRYEEARLHTEGLLDPNTKPLTDNTVIEWYPEDQLAI
jgi:hypothetical protein